LLQNPTMSEDIYQKLNNKYRSIGEKPENYLEGLYHSKPITYWDYVEVDTLLSLQKPRTNFKDESIFIMYHQVTELVLKMMIHEAEQLVFEEKVSLATFKEKVKRLTRYTDMLITSFSVMKDGMSYEDYNEFRMTLTPASGFQSAQFRFLEIYCTPLINLIPKKNRNFLPDNPEVTDYFKLIYWRAAGYDPKTEKKSLTLTLFEDKYLEDFLQLAEKMKGKTMYDRYLKNLEADEELNVLLKDFDHAYNVKWPLTHLSTAKKYLDKKGENKDATGGSEWKKYLHPKHQGRLFFPSLWKENSILDHSTMV